MQLIRRQKNKCCHLYLSISTCSFVYLSLYLPVYLPTSRPTHLSTFLPLFLCTYLYMFICPTSILSTCLPIYRTPVYQFTCLLVYLSTCLPIRLSTCHLGFQYVYMYKVNINDLILSFKIHKNNFFINFPTTPRLFYLPSQNCN